MTEIAAKAAPVTVDSSQAANLVRRRNAAEKRFRAYGMIAIGLALTFLVTLFGSIFYNGLSADGGEHRCDAGNTQAHPGRPTRQRT